MSIRTDLAIEVHEECRKSGSGEVNGVRVEENKEGNVNVTKVSILDENGERSMGKPIGNYITIDIPEFAHYDTEIKDEVSTVFARSLSSLLNFKENMSALVVGLGNWNVTPDALGPKVVSKLMITRHLKQLVPDSIDENIRPVCAISPGVLGITGIETGEVIKGVVDKVKPDVIICIDSLASRSLARVNSTIQIGDTGLAPGSGVGNRRMEFSKKTMGVPVIAVGVPTVVDAATIANDTIDMVIDSMITESKNGTEFYNMLKSINRDEKQKLIEEVLNPYSENLMVTPKEVDMLIDSLSRIIANGINISLQPSLSKEEIDKYIN